jgi:hypothetical protein
MTEAEQFARLVLSQNSAFAGPEAFRLAKLFLNAGNGAVGGALLTIAINKSPTYTPALVELSNFYMGQADKIPSGALFDVPELIKSASSDTADYQLLGQYARLIGAKGSYTDAIEMANRSIQLYAYDHYLYEQKSAWENAFGLQEQAAESLAKAANLKAAQI